MAGASGGLTDQLARTLDTYRNSITESTTLILSPNGEFFRCLKQLERPSQRQSAPRYRAPAGGVPFARARRGRILRGGSSSGSAATLCARKIAASSL